MTLRIVTQDSEGEPVIALHGWLSAWEVEEVEKLVADRSGRLRIDLAQLAGVDADGLRSLRRLQAGGARLTGASPYVALLLERTFGEEGDDDATKNGGT